MDITKLFTRGAGWATEARLARRRNRRRTYTVARYRPDPLEVFEERVVPSIGFIGGAAGDAELTGPFFNNVSLANKIGLTATVPQIVGNTLSLGFTNSGTSSVTVGVAPYLLPMPVALQGEVLETPAIQSVTIPSGTTTTVTVPLYPCTQIDAFISAIGSTVIQTPPTAFTPNDTMPTSNSGPPVDAGFNALPNGSGGYMPEAIHGNPTGTYPSGLLGTLVSFALLSGPSGVDPDPASGGVYPGDCVQQVSGTDYLVPNTTPASSLTPATTGVPIAGTTVTLTGTDEFGNPVSATTTTNGSGQYTFTGLNLSNASGYTVTETPPASDVHLGQTSTTPGAVTTPPPTPVVSNIVLTTNGSSSTDNFFETPTPTPAFDLAITKTDGTTTYTPGGSTTYTIVVSNNGPSAVTGAAVNDLVPAAITSDTWTAVASAGASVTTSSGTGSIVNDLVSLVPGATVTFTLVAQISPSATGNLTNTATVGTTATSPSGVTDSNPANNTATDTDTPTAAFDLAITKTDGTTTYTPGGSTTYTIVVSNNGPSAVTGAAVNDLLPASITSAIWMAVASSGASVTTSFGTGSIVNDLVNLVPGATVTFTLVAQISPSATGNLTNTATVGTTATTPAGVTDSNPSNNTATDTDTPTAAFDLAITKTDGTTTYTPGGSTTYTIVVSNNGPSAVTGAAVNDLVPAAITSDTWTAVASAGASVTTSSGTGSIVNDLVSLVPGATVTFTLVAQISPSATGNLVNTATVATTATTPVGVTDSNPANNTATDTDTPTAAFDLAITKTDGTTTYTPGGSTTYTIVVSNNGPSAVTGAAVNDLVPAAITSDTWTAVASAGASVTTSSGTGSIVNDLVNLVPGATVTFTLVAQISPSATGNLTNTATVGTTATTPAGVTDSNPSNNTATDTDTPTPAFDLAITKTDGTTTYTPGGSTTYTIVVSNNGPSAVTGAAVNDLVPAAITSDTWTAVASAGASVTTSSGTGSIVNDLVSLVPGATVTFTLVAQISPSATGNLVNTATVATTATTPVGVTDSNPANNTATDTDTPTAAFDLAITKTDGTTTYTPGGSTTYTIVVSNNGPSAVTGAAVNDLVPAAITSDTWTAVASAGASVTTSSGTGSIVNDLVSLVPGATVTFTLVAQISPSATGNLTNTATVGTTATTPAGVTDSNPANNTATDTDTFTPPPLAELSGVVFEDFNGDLIPQPGEPGISGVTVTLTGKDINGNTVSQTTTTDANGFYGFTGLNPSNSAGYTVTETQPSMYTHEGQKAGSTGGTTGNHTITTVLNGGADSVSNDFAETCPPGAGNIGSNFNGTGIAFNPVSGQNNYIWFNSVVNVSGLSTTQATTLNYVNQFVTFTYTDPVTKATVTENLAVPNASLTFSPTATTATETFNSTTNTWVTVVPSSGLSGNVFLAGLAFKVPADGLPGGINPVTWTGNFTTNTAGIKVNWQWAAAVYNNFTSNYNSLLVKPVDDNHVPIFDNGTSVAQNSDHAGTPEAYTIAGILPGGARGGGGSNWTGSYSGTQSTTPCSTTSPGTNNLAAGDAGSINFWANPTTGQALIDSLNGGSTATALGSWLATNFPNLFGSLAGATNASVAAYFLNLKNHPVASSPLEAQVLGLALSNYVTNSTLAGMTAASYGFTVSALGNGARTVIVGSNGSVLGLTSNTTYTVLQVLQAANSDASGGSLFPSNPTSRNAANSLFDEINSIGDIG